MDISGLMTTDVCATANRKQMGSNCNCLLRSTNEEEPKVTISICKSHSLPVLTKLHPNMLCVCLLVRQWQMYVTLASPLLSLQQSLTLVC